MLETSGETAWWKARVAAQSFSSFLLLHGLLPPNTLELLDVNGERSTVTVAGLAQDSLDAIAARNRVARAAQPTRPPNFTYRKLEDGSGYIDFYSMAGDIRSFRSRIASTFGQIARDSVRVLIVDLRNNGGGDSRLGEALLDHFVDKPYRSAAAKEWRASDEYRSFMRKGLGRGTFSSAMETADAIKAYHLAPLLGEETGGLPNAFGELYTFRLPRTGLVASVSSARYVRASGDTTDHGPVRPDVVIHRTAEDLRLGRDPVLEQARRCEELTRALSAG
jgi:C-terminal processing protease CtpA/Prc